MSGFLEDTISREEAALLEKREEGESWLKLSRSFLDFEWFSNHLCVALYVYLLLKCNIKPKWWNNVLIGSGELVTSLEHLAEAMGVKTGRIRTALDNLEKSGYILRKVARGFTHLKVLKYWPHEGSDAEGSQRTRIGLASDLQQTRNEVATTKEEYKDKNYKRDIYYAGRQRKNYFSDYDNEPSEFEIEAMMKRIARNADM